MDLRRCPGATDKLQVCVSRVVWNTKYNSSHFHFGAVDVKTLTSTAEL